MPVTKTPINKKIKICVIGDIMLDHYINGSCDRISPEAPVQVVDVATEAYSLGGAGNVLKNLKALGCEASIISICGNDTTSKILDTELSNTHPAFYYLAKDSTRQSTIKTRVIVSRHQLLRLDKEDKHYCDKDIANELIDFFKKKVTDIDVLIISDYCKGVLSPYLVKELLAICNQYKVITIVDSKHKDLSKYKGATLIKPNKKEAALASGISITNDDTLEQACKIIADIAACKTVVVTLSEDGIAIYNEEKLTKIPTKAIEVFDVTGAGDTVIAALGFALANKMDIKEACNFANHAAAVVVAKFGSAVATLDEINNIS
ncbi:D-glycero-beta-D-manno-heptose-7-phosphate kinase [Mucilaginibacter boryungensis]|uniref:D-glycero-beta-D-manno-heptose-7-phosphate kinase n=1 Tax=Mucilaginibacter boryungensis TaxID=768480 RepID=A0ABR9XFA9_9SPHI|nr:D-glycero-beta-D-manno-heptose-7-phosphate kinase [Mucilaginibacter boryungensis]MBE9665855.1 D-glycero-beta-D-manno-heptose-7-phosphate kinase [Mucilaginibacter boryungensis]